MNLLLARSLTTIPINLNGLGFMLMGIAWIALPEPWLLDKVANEILVQTSYQVLLNIPGSEGLDDYLRAVYAFFGLWVFSMGLLILIVNEPLPPRRPANSNPHMGEPFQVQAIRRAETWRNLTTC